MNETTQKDNIKSEIKSEAKSLILVILLAMSIRIFIIEPFYVPTGSMKATILEGDYIFCTKYSYGFSNYSIPFSPNIIKDRIFAKQPERGDIIIMRPPHNMEIRFVKRLIGLPGDKIEIINNLIYINNKPIIRKEIGEYIGEDGKEYLKYEETLPNNVRYYAYKFKQLDYIDLRRNRLTDYGPRIVPEGHFFFLGDNRDDSGDSRFDLGFVPFKNLVAKARVVVFSTEEAWWKNDISMLEQITRLWTWLSSIRFNRLFTNLYISNDE